MIPLSPTLVNIITVLEEHACNKNCFPPLISNDLFRENKRLIAKTISVINTSVLP
jgi:hypothetical protein